MITFDSTNNSCKNGIDENIREKMLKNMLSARCKVCGKKTSYLSGYRYALCERCQIWYRID